MQSYRPFATSGERAANVVYLDSGIPDVEILGKECLLFTGYGYPASETYEPWMPSHTALPRTAGVRPRRLRPKERA